MSTAQALTGELLLVSLDGLGSPSLSIHLQQNENAGQSHGWGFGWYPNDHQAAMLTKDPVARSARVLVDAITDWSNFRSTVFFSKIHHTKEGASQTQIQPFAKSYAGRDWMFMHNGQLDKVALEGLIGDKTQLLEPLGNTDSELAFCHLIYKIRACKARSIADIAPTELHAWLVELDNLGVADIYLTDADSVVCFQSAHSLKPLQYSRIQPTERLPLYVSSTSQLALNDPRDTYRTALMVSSSPFAEGVWTRLQPQQMLIIRRGLVVWDSAKSHDQDNAPSSYIAPTHQENTLPLTGPLTSIQAEQAQMKMQDAVQAPGHVLNVRALTQTSDGLPLGFRKFEVQHTTHYEYTTPVEHSTHIFRLQPTDDHIQEVVQSRLAMSSASEEILYDDVFGNQAIHSTINKPYSKLTVSASSIVKIFAMPPDDHSLSRRQTSIPLVWMPWQRQMMMPYLLPSELPESQLTELTEYAMSFVARNDYHLLRTIEDLNLSLYRDYAYMPGKTSLSTTPFEVYTSRQGVCQDFANLFICLMRLLSIPARYRMGYIYTGGNYTNKIQSDASHAWAEVYLPYVGWRGFDPTNGCQVKQDHIRVACGRNYRDATPTSGTIYKGGGTETLTVDVKINELND